MKKTFDIIIVGGGLVGTSLAIALAKYNFSIAIVEANSKDHSIHAGNRSIVLSHSSKIILETLDIWKNLKQFACPIHEIHISDFQHFGATRIQACDEDVPALGYVVDAKIIAAGLDEAIQQYPNIHLICPAKFMALEVNKKGGHITCKVGQDDVSFTAKLIVATDGQNSAVRQQQNIDITRFDYQQTAIICNVQLKRDHHNVAYERFTKTGSIALLPLCEQQNAIVWVVHKEEAKELLSLNNCAFLEKLQNMFGYRAGRLLHPTQRVAIPLQLIISKEQIRPHLVLLGNAVHTLHPIAGQGLNLGLRDMAVLAEEIVAATKQDIDHLNDFKVLQRYLKRRREDQHFMVTFTHQLIGIFSNSFLPLVLLRNLGLILIDIMPPIKRLLAQRALGTAGHVPRLACGLPLG